MTSSRAPRGRGIRVPKVAPAQVGRPSTVPVPSLAAHPRRRAYAALQRPRDLCVNVLKHALPRPRLPTADDAEFVFDAIAGTVAIPWTMQCNQRCRYCAVRDDSVRSPPLPEPVLLGLAADAVAGKFRKALLIGGEPTVRPGLAAFVRQLRELGLEHVALGTNAVALATRGAVSQLVDAGVDAFSVSLDSPDPEVQAFLTRNPDNADRVERAAAEIVRHDGVLLLFFALLCRQTLPGLVRLVERVAALRGRGRARVALCLTGLKPVGAALRHPELHVRYREMEPAWSAALARASAFGLPLIDFNLPACVFAGNEHRRWEHRIEEAIWNADLGILFHDPAHERNHVRLAACARCVFRRECPGVYRGYVERWGTAEFRARLRRTA